MEIARKIPDRKAESMCAEIDAVKRQIHSLRFCPLFKSITADKGGMRLRKDGHSALQENRFSRIMMLDCVYNYSDVDNVGEYAHSPLPARMLDQITLADRNL